MMPLVEEWQRGGAERRWKFGWTFQRPSRVWRFEWRGQYPANALVERVIVGNVDQIAGPEPLPLAVLLIDVDLETVRVGSTLSVIVSADQPLDVLELRPLGELAR